MSPIRQLAKAIFAAADVFLPSPRGPRILIYHQVGAGLGRQMEVTTEDFVWQLDWLAQNRHVVGLDEALERWEEEGSENLVVLTFDDGYRDVHTTAFPLLKERGMPFTLYLATRAIETGNGHPGAEPLKWGQIEEMIASGLVTIGSHTHNHADLRALSTDEIVREIETSNELIESHFGLIPIHFAYPWGYWSVEADSIIRHHFRSAALGSHSVGRIRGSDPFQMHRVPIQLNDGTMWFSSRIRGGLLAEEALRRILRGYRGP
jgi:peptidoglycan/xylan/chitin deacetylase (PgdA/CDA1 family)